MATPVEGPENSGQVAARPPVGMGGVVNSVIPATAATGQRKDLWLSTLGAVVLAGVSSNGFDGVSPVSPTDQAGNTGRGVPGMLFNGATWDRPRTPVVFKHFASTAITAGVGATIWTPAGGKKFRLMGWVISSSAAGQLLFGDNVVGTIIARSEAVAAAGVSNVGDGLGNGILSAAANNVLKIDGPTGNVAGMVWGTEE